MSILKYIFFNHTRLTSGFLLALSAVLMMTNCEEDSFSQVIEIDLPTHEPKPVVKLEITAEDSYFDALVSISKGIIEEGDYELPEDAELNLYRNDIEEATFFFADDVFKYTGYFDDDVSSNGGDEYRLEVTVPGHEMVTATQIMPKKPLVIDASYEEEGAISPDGDRVNEIIIDITDVEPGVTNYYAIGVYYETFIVDQNGDTIQHGRNHVYLDSNDPLLTYSDRYDLVLSDDAYNSHDIQVRAYTYESLPEDGVLGVYLYHLSRDAYLYSVSLNQFYDSVDNPFAEPVIVHSNINNGYGIFSLTNFSTFYVEP